jgi:hypothetical protein
MKNDHITSSPAGHSRKRGGIFFILISRRLAQSGHSDAGKTSAQHTCGHQSQRLIVVEVDVSGTMAKRCLVPFDPVWCQRVHDRGVRIEGDVNTGG